MPLLHKEQEATDAQGGTQRADDFSWLDHATSDPGESNFCLCFKAKDQADCALRSVQDLLSKNYPEIKAIFVSEHFDEDASRTSFRFVLSDVYWGVLSDHLRRKIREDSKCFKIEGDFLIKTINKSSKPGYDHIIRLFALSERTALRPPKKEKFTVNGNGVFQRVREEGKELEAPLKVPQYTREKKQGFSQIHAFTLATPKANPKPYSSQHAGVLIPATEEYALFSNRLFTSDGYTNARLYDSGTLEEAERYWTNEKATLYSCERLESFKQAIEAGGHGSSYNEVLVRVKWIAEHDSKGNYPCVFIPSDSLLPRVRAIELARIGEKDLRDAGKCDASYRIPIIHYDPESPLHFKEYSSREQQLDQLEFDKCKLEILSDRKDKLLDDSELRRMILEGDADLIEALSTIPWDADRRDSFGNTALICAVRNRNKEVDQSLIRLWAKGKHGHAPLTFMSPTNNDELVKTLLEQGANPNLQDGSGYTALMVAVNADKEVVAELLIEHKADVSLQDKNGDTALMHAVLQHKDPFFELVVKHDKACVNLQNQCGFTVLMLAVLKDKRQWAEFFLEQGADADIKDHDGDTALMLAVTARNTPCVELLLEHRADADTKNHDGNTALMLGITAGSIRCVELLLEHRADADTKNHDGNTALMLAVLEGNVELVKLFLARVTGINSQNGVGFTALMLAVTARNTPCVELLLEHGADLNLQNGLGFTALMLAITARNTPCVELLLEHGADLNLQNHIGFTALMLAVVENNAELAKLLLESQAGVDIENKAGNTALMIGITAGNMRCVELLLEHGADVNPENNRHQTALMCAPSSLSAVTREKTLIQRLNKYPSLVPDDITKPKEVLRGFIASRISFLSSLQGAECGFFQNQDGVQARAAERKVLELLSEHFDDPVAIQEDPVFNKACEAALNENDELRNLLAAHQVLMSKQQGRSIAPAASECVDLPENPTEGKTYSENLKVSPVQLL